MERVTRWIVLTAVVGIAIAGGIAVVGFGGTQPVHAENVSCETGTSIRCDAVLVNENNDTRYTLAVKVIGYDENGDIVTTYTEDATNGGNGIADISSGGVENITISTSSSERVAEGDVRVVDVEAVDE